MILLTDPICNGEFHLYFNKELLRLMDMDNKHVGWVGDSAFGISLLSEKSSFGFLYKKNSAFESLRRFFKIFIRILSTKYGKIFFLSFDNTFFPLFSLILSPFLTKKMIFVVVHNNVYTLKNHGIKRRLFLLTNKILDVRFISLTYSMKKELDQALNTNSTLVHHPIIFLGKKRTFINNHKVFLSLGNHEKSTSNEMFYSNIILLLEKLSKNKVTLFTT